MYPEETTHPSANIRQERRDSSRNEIAAEVHSSSRRGYRSRTPPSPTLSHHPRGKPAPRDQRDRSSSPRRSSLKFPAQTSDFQVKGRSTDAKTRGSNVRERGGPRSKKPPTSMGPPRQPKKWSAAGEPVPSPRGPRRGGSDSNARNAPSVASASHNSLSEPQHLAPVKNLSFVAPMPFEDAQKLFMGRDRPVIPVDLEDLYGMLSMLQRSIDVVNDSLWKEERRKYHDSLLLDFQAQIEANDDTVKEAQHFMYASKTRLTNFSSTFQIHARTLGSKLLTQIETELINSELLSAPGILPAFRKSRDRQYYDIVQDLIKAFDEGRVEMLSYRDKTQASMDWYVEKRLKEALKTFGQLNPEAVQTFRSLRSAQVDNVSSRLHLPVIAFKDSVPKGYQLRSGILGQTPTEYGSRASTGPDKQTS